tara:strand:+ start:29 stop:631 length:603 start_codon:yes stop_codon:yes gene_type:complete
MENIFFGFFTGGSLIIAIGPQNLFVIEQGLKKNFVFLVTTICTLSDIFLIFLGIYFFSLFSNIVFRFEIILNILLIIFLLFFIKNKISRLNDKYSIDYKADSENLKVIVYKTLGFTYLNPHVYSDTIFILGNFSKNFELNDKLLFGFGASVASFIYFFALGYSAKFFSSFIQREKTWKMINIFIIFYMSCITSYVIFSLF